MIRWGSESELIRLRKGRTRLFRETPSAPAMRSGGDHRRPRSHCCGGSAFFLLFPAVPPDSRTVQLVCVGRRPRCPAGGRTWSRSCGRRGSVRRFGGAWVVSGVDSVRSRGRSLGREGRRVTETSRNQLWRTNFVDSDLGIPPLLPSVVYKGHFGN